MIELSMTEASKLERQLAEQGHLLDDPLALHESLINLYTREGKSSLLIKALEKCTQQLVHDRRYRNDIRYLRVWLQYARHCRQPLEIFEFLAAQGIGKELSLFYEEWAKVLRGCDQVDKGRSVLKRGIELNAQPLERLKNTFAEYVPNGTHKRSSWENNGQGIPWTKQAASATGKKEVRYYDPEVIDHGKLTFEQARARHYREQKAKERKAAPIKPEDDDDEEVPGLSQPINPDELTHISVYKDNTMDVKELNRIAKTAIASSNALNEFIEAHKNDLNIKISDSLLLPRLSAITLNSASGAEGKTQTISAIKTVLGHYFLESTLGEGEFIAVDVGSVDVEAESAKQVLSAIKIDEEHLGLYEAITLRNQGVAVKVARYADCLILVRPHYPGGTLQALADKKYKFEPILSLFFARELMSSVSALHAQRIYHGNVTLGTVHITFSLPKGGGVALTGFKPVALVKGESSAREVDLNGIQSVCASLYQSTLNREESGEWKELIGYFQKKRDLPSIVESVSERIAEYRKRPSLRSLLISLETEMLSDE